MRTTITAAILTVLVLATAGPAAANWDEGVAAFQSGNFSEAARHFQTVVESTPDYANGHFMLGQALSQLNREQDALNAFRKAYDLKPSNLQFQLALANGYVEVERYSDAARLYEMIDPSALPAKLQSPYHKNKAVAMSKSGRKAEALAARRAVARSNPNDAGAQYRYGTAAFNQGDTSTAVDALARAVQIAPEPKHRKAYLKALIRQARETRDQKTAIYSTAVEQAKALASADPGYESLLTLGEAQLGAKQYEAAADSFAKAGEQKSGHWLAPYYRSQALTSLGRYEEAEEALRAALAADLSADNEKRVYRQIGFVNEKMKKFEQAKTAYTRAGDQQSAARVEENQRIADENREIEAENRRLEEMRREREELEQELKELEEGPPPF